MHSTIHLRITGRVHGVGYRYALRSEAQAKGISGWVRNCRDGTVEAFVQGDSQAVEMLIAWAQRGPPAARVAAVDARPAQGEFDRPFRGFEELPTA
jgi:acylphosphatase